MMCICGTFNVKTGKGKCSEDCKHGAWNYTGMCGAECLDCGGDLYETKDGIYCVDEDKIVDTTKW